MGLVDLTLGFSKGYDQVPSAASALQDYVDKIAALPGVKPAKPDWLSGYHLSPDTTIRHWHQIAEIVANLVQQVSGGEQ